MQALADAMGSGPQVPALHPSGLVHSSMLTLHDAPVDLRGWHCPVAKSQYDVATHASLLCPHAPVLRLAAHVPLSQKASPAQGVVEVQGWFSAGCVAQVRVSAQ
jgi:hypothetical protein